MYTFFFSGLTVPPPLADPWQPRTLRGMEVPDELRVHDVSGGHPGPPDSQQPSHSVHRPPINDPGEQRGFGGRDEWAFHDWLDTTHMEGRMDLGGPGKLQSHSRAVNNF